jgi:PAS domain S-box-containing protein
MKSTVPLDLFKFVVDESPDGFMVCDSKGVVVYTNKSYLEASDRREEEMVGHNMQEFIEGGFLKESAALIAVTEKRKVEKLSMIRDGVPLAITSIPVFGSRGNIKYVVTRTRDISQLTLMKKNLGYLLKMVENYNTPGKRSLGDVDDFVAVSLQIKQIFELAENIKDVLSTVMLYGESGVGKDVIAKYIHNNSVRRHNPFICINCGAIPEQLLETELFGYTGGAFTDAIKTGKKGLFEMAQEGTLFLDEVGDMSLALQAKLLRVLENRTVIPVGDHREIPIDVRIIAATNKNLETMVQEKMFREDLYYRLNILPIQVPSLRERPDDIIPLCLFYLKKFCKQYNRAVNLSHEVMDMLEKYYWPGNVRELKNIIERLVVTCKTGEVKKSDLTFHLTSQSMDLGVDNDIIVRNIIPLDHAVSIVEKQILAKARLKYGSCRKIAKILKLNYSTVARKLQFYHLQS